MTSQGSAHTVFRRALRSGDPRSVLLALSAVERVNLHDAFAVVLVLADAGDRRYDRAAARLVERVAAELKAPIGSTAMLACALAALPGADDKEPLAGMAAQLLAALGCRDASRELEAWRDARAARS